jgi:tRNA(Met) C34 N-acetyltransferase TmcA
MICRKPHVASSISLRTTIFQNPDKTLWIHCSFVYVTLHCVGVPLSGLISEIFLQTIEFKIKHVLEKRHTLFYERYVDDIIYDASLITPEKHIEYFQ